VTERTFECKVLDEECLNCEKERLAAQKLTTVQVVAPNTKELAYTDAQQMTALWISFNYRNSKYTWTLI
jgi:hypothetical protein